MSFYFINCTTRFIYSLIFRKKTSHFQHLHFATNKTRILPSSEGALNDLYMYLERNPEVRIKIMGHTDNKGSDVKNQKLSERRAEAVVKYLSKRGVDKARLRAVGFGMTQPIADNDDADGRAQNRRVELVPFYNK